MRYPYPTAEEAPPITLTSIYSSLLTMAIIIGSFGDICHYFPFPSDSDQTESTSNTDTTSEMLSHIYMQTFCFCYYSSVSFCDSLLVFLLSY